MSENRKFNVGRQSEQLYNEELYKMYESIRTLLMIPEEGKDGPESNLHGALWLNLDKNELNYYNKELNAWDIIFRDKFRIVDSMLNHFPPDRPVQGQLWINQDVLMYYDGLQWKPIKALMQDGSQINLAVFEDFIILSPLHPPGNTVVNDPESDVVVDETNKSQFLVPNIDAGKYFVNREYRHDYEEINKVTLQYPKEMLNEKVSSWVHVNPGKITNIKKQLFKVDKLNQTIELDPYNTEFYGFRRDSAFGHFLRPGDGAEDEGDYYAIPEGIQLSYNAAQSFDYVLAVSYEFSWIKSTGRLNRTSSERITTNYYVGGFGGPINVFVEGYDLENRYYHYDTLTEMLEITDPNMDRDFEISIFEAISREYGLIRERTLDGRGIIHLRNKYRNPLVFVNGQALHSSLGDIEINDAEGIILVNGARRDMSYCVMELDDVENNHNMFVKSGVVNEIVDYQGVIRIPDFANVIPEEDGIILFVDGLLIKKEDVVRDYSDESITVNGLERGQEFILLHDKYHALQYDESRLHSALVTGRVDESLVYMNEFLICNDTAIVTSRTMEEETPEAVNGEIKLFLEPQQDVMEGQFKIWDEYNKTWQDLDADTLAAVKLIAFSYENGLNMIQLNIDHDENDFFDVFAYSFANHIEKPVVIESFTCENQQEFNIRHHFIHGANSLQVYLDGVRQYDNVVTEYVDGSGFKLNAPFTGKVTYVIEHPEGGAQKACTREVLDHTNVLAGSPNVYKTNISLYPGRVTVYVSGLRQPQESYVILDNHTILFNDRETMLIGSQDNYPTEHVRKEDGEIVELNRRQQDEILVEVRQKFDRQEQTIQVKDIDEYDIGIQKYDLPPDIIEAADEILIYINGIFTGLRNGIGYVKDRSKGAITVLDGNYVELMNNDPLYTLFMLDVDKHFLWQQRHDGQPYEPKINNKVTLEWR
ncbi:hypothetical protein [Heyndrickxia sporothermodurans]|uniref:hypothetical protein n=1 Tax=Heyndrickxia sporothermodurans TaxID=46224 RepID=UPI000D398B72|nr:hypothetical protein [Heyndrickxia sporothermodurans]PTY93104.1 hypothetical protein B5V90_03190 [Heyndrickxia sporothermodurans]